MADKTNEKFKIFVYDEFEDVQNLLRKDWQWEIVLVRFENSERCETVSGPTNQRDE